MADLLYTTEWKDHNGIDTSVNWFRKGVTSGLSQYKFTAGGTPLVTRWNADNITDIIKGSDITFNIMIQDSADEAELLKLLNDTYYVSVVKNGTNRWLGQLFPRFFNHTYNTYPYQVTLTANDRLGLLKDNQEYLIDFPEPGSIYSVGQMLSIVLNEMNDGVTYYQHAPQELRISTTLYYTTVNKLLEEVYLDPRVFMDEDDQYLSWYELLGAMLEPLGLSILQHDGVWWLIDLDSYIVDGLTLDYVYYTFTSGDILYGGTGVETVLVDLFANKDDNKLINSTAYKSYTQPVSKLTIKENYETRLNVFDTAANRSGNFYDGEDGVELEITTGDQLRHWTPANNAGMYKVRYEENSGWMQIFDLYTMPYNATWTATKSLNINSNQFQFLRFNAGFYVPKPINALNFQFILKWESVGAGTGNTYTRYLHYNQADNLYEWQTTSTVYIHYVENKAGSESMSFETIIPDVGELQESIVLTWSIAPVNLLITETHGLTYLIKNLRIQCVNNVMESFNGVITNEYPVADNVVKNEVTKTFRWGLGWNGSIYTGISYDPDLTLSRILNSAGEPDNIMQSLLFPEAHNLILYKNKYIRYNNSPKPVLNGDIRSFDVINPLSLVQDYEGNKYVMINASLDDKLGVWTGKWQSIIESSGDYNGDYNDDYYK